MKSEKLIFQIFIMMNINRKKIIDFLNPSLIQSRQCFREDWYFRKNHKDILEIIFSETEFLPIHSKICERIYYIQNNLFAVKKCIICQNNQARHRNNVCKNVQCQKINKNRNQSFIQKNQTEETKAKRGKSISEYWKKNKKVVSEETRKKMSIASTGRKQSEEEKIKRSNSIKKYYLDNPEYSKIRSDISKNMWQNDEYRKKQYSSNSFIGPKSIKERKIISERMKKDIASGKFTPNITNTWTHFSAQINDKKYRSSWDALFAAINPNFQYEKIRIPYTFENKNRTFIVDFYDETNNTIFEIKPKGFQNDLINIEKFKAAYEFAKDNSMNFEIIDETYFQKNISKINFNDYDNKLTKLWSQWIT